MDETTIAESTKAMNRISGSLAVLAGLFLLLPGVFAMLHAGSSTVTMPGWIVRDLVITSLTGVALMFWGAGHIRHREMELNEIQPIRVRSRR
jgi:hypothetical protein